MILLFVMLTALMLISLVGAIGVLSKRNLNDVVNQVDSKRAKYAAYAGLSETLARLKTNSNWNAGLTNPSLDSKLQHRILCDVIEFGQTIGRQLCTWVVNQQNLTVPHLLTDQRDVDLKIRGHVLRILVLRRCERERIGIEDGRVL